MNAIAIRQIARMSQGLTFGRLRRIHPHTASNAMSVRRLADWLPDVLNEAIVVPSAATTRRE
jgi:hypothetical protein